MVQPAQLGPGRGRPVPAVVAGAGRVHPGHAGGVNANGHLVGHGPSREHSHQAHDREDKGRNFVTDTPEPGLELSRAGSGVRESCRGGGRIFDHDL